MWWGCISDIWPDLGGMLFSNKPQHAKLEVLISRAGGLQISTVLGSKIGWSVENLVLDSRCYQNEKDMHTQRLFDKAMENGTWKFRLSTWWSMTYRDLYPFEKNLPMPSAKFENPKRLELIWQVVDGAASFWAMGPNVFKKTWEKKGQKQCFEACLLFPNAPRTSKHLPIVVPTQPLWSVCQLYNLYIYTHTYILNTSSQNGAS